MDVETVKLANRWIIGAGVGMSSKAIWSHMMDVGEPDWGWSHPRDPDDLSRCIILLKIIPEWHARISEMAQRSPEWAALVLRWDEIVDSMEDEVGYDWAKGQSAPKTYALMCSILDEVRHGRRCG